LDYAYAHGISDFAIKEISHSEHEHWNIAMHRADTWGRMDSLCVRIAPSFKFSLHLHTEDIVHNHEKTLERRVRSLASDTFMVSMGFLWDFKTKQWSTKAYNRIALRSPNNVLNVEHAEKCFEGFTMENAKKLSSSILQCPICDEPSTRLLETCGHAYCKDCLDTMFNTNNTDEEKCPECRVAFWKENILEVKAVKPQRRRNKDMPFARQTALSRLIPETKGPLQADNDYILIITPLDAAIDTLQSWSPGIHIASLETLGLRGPSSPKFSKLILVSPYVPGVIHLDRFHQILQSWTLPEFELHTIALKNGSQCEDTQWISSLTKSYSIVS